MQILTEQLIALSAKLGQICNQQRLTLTTAESCTGGLIAAMITEIPGSSAWFDRGFVTYSNAAKQEMLGVQVATLDQYGAVSERTAQEMARGALQHSRAQWSVAITGIAGPEGGSVEKPVGTVWLAWGSRAGALQTCLKQFSGDRAAVRQQAAEFALLELIAMIAPNK